MKHGLSSSSSHQFSCPRPPCNHPETEVFSLCTPPTGTLAPKTQCAHTRPCTGLLYLTVTSLQADVSYYIQSLFPKEARRERQEGIQPWCPLFPSVGQVKDLKRRGSSLCEQTLIPSPSCLPVTPFASIIFSAALATAQLRDSLPTLFILLEFKARFCLVVPKASIQESICAATNLVCLGTGWALLLLAVWLWGNSPPFLARTPSPVNWGDSYLSITKACINRTEYLLCKLSWAIYKSMVSICTVKAWTRLRIDKFHAQPTIFQPYTHSRCCLSLTLSHWAWGQSHVLLNTALQAVLKPQLTCHLGWDHPRCKSWSLLYFNVRASRLQPVFSATCIKSKIKCYTTPMSAQWPSSEHRHEAVSSFPRRKDSAPWGREVSAGRLSGEPQTQWAGSSPLLSQLILHGETRS